MEGAGIGEILGNKSLEKEEGDCGDDDVKLSNDGENLGNKSSLECVRREGEEGDCGDEDVKLSNDAIRDMFFDQIRDKFDVEDLPLVRDPSLKGFGGILKEDNLYFIVEEIPLITFDNVKTHVFVKVSRSGIDTKQVQKRLGRLFGCLEDSIGCGGLKDKNAHTTQTFSIPINRSKNLENDCTADDVNKLFEQEEGSPKLQFHKEATRFHSKSIRKGQIEGNAFEILITKLDVPLDEAYERALKVLEDLKPKGCPNYFGVQRLGSKGSNALEGVHYLFEARNYLSSIGFDDDKSCEKRRKVGTGIVDKRSFYKWRRVEKLKRVSPWLHEFKLHAFQSGLFNLFLAERINQKMFFSDVVGDRVSNQVGGKYRIVSDSSLNTSEEARLDGFSFCLPLLGSKYKFPDGAPKEVEEKVSKLFLETFSDKAFRLCGLTTSMRVGRLSVPKFNMEITKIPDVNEYLKSKQQQLKLDQGDTETGTESGLLFRLNLPSGAYATSVLREFMK